MPPLNVLLLEDHAADAELLIMTLRRAGFEPAARRVQTEDDYLAALRAARASPAAGLDLILADYSLPQFDAPRALQLLQHEQLDVPFIVVTGNLGEEPAVECLKNGAADYLLKDRLARLGPAVVNALHAKQLRNQKRQAEAALRESQAHLQTIIDHSPVILCAVNREGLITLVEGKGLQALGLKSGQGVGRPITEAMRRLPEILSHFQRALAGETHAEITHLGSLVYEAHYSPLTDETGAIMGMIAVAIDITARHRAETVQAAIYRISEAAQSALNLNDLYRALHAIIGELMPARNFYIALYDPAAATLTFPYYADEYDVTDPVAAFPLGRGLTEYILRTGQPMLVPPEKFDELVAAGEVERVGTDSIDWIGVPLRTPTGILGVLVVQTYAETVRLTEIHKDILVFVSSQVAMAIERKRAEERLRESEERFRVLAENIPGVIYLCRNDARYSMIYLNDEVQHLTGYPKEDFLADRLSFVELYHPDDAPNIPLQVNQALAEGRPFHLIYRLRHRSGEWRWVEEWGTTVSLGGPQWSFLEGFLSDITDRRQAEAALRQAQKMESLGILAGGVAHDFNNLLVAMLGQASLALARLPADPVSARDSVEKAVKAAERAADLTRQLLAYSGRGQFTVRAIQLNDLIRENLSLLAVSLPKPVRLHTALAPDLPFIEGDPGQVQQIIMNLILNAAEAIGQRPGAITVRTGMRVVSEADMYWWQYTSEPLPPGGYVLLQVEDDGNGMEAATLASIFDPFFTTKFTGRGLGLAAVLGIVRGHGGGLHVTSEIGRGTTFQLLFPASAAKPAPGPEAAPTISAAKPAARLILVIDDEDPVREAVSDILDMEGIPVLAAADGAAGLELYYQRQAEIRLVLLDLSMPGLSGEETFHALRRINPDVRVVLSSGYSQTEAARRFTDQPVAGFLQKPYDVDALIAEVWRHLR
jgi:PAS domain S-box-containing protein